MLFFFFFFIAHKHERVIASLWVGLNDALDVDLSAGHWCWDTRNGAGRKNSRFIEQNQCLHIGNVSLKYGCFCHSMVSVYLNLIYNKQYI